MCGRFANDLPPELIQRVFATANAVPNVRPSWNIAPTMECAVVRLHPETRARHLDLLRWGLVPFNTPDREAAVPRACFRVLRVEGGASRQAAVRDRAG